MYHSHLLINVGDNPDRPDWNITRRWLRNLYRVHQRLSMAFPSPAMASALPADRVAAYCRPYNEMGYPEGRALPGESENADVHHTRNDGAGFLFRIDYPVDHKRGVRRPVIVVQSATKPDWHYAFGLDAGAVDDRGHPIGNAGFLLAAPPQTKEVSIDCDGNTLMLTCPERPSLDCEIKTGDLVRFCLRANPVYTKDRKRRRLQISPEDFNAGSTREAAFRKAHEDWLQRKLGSAGDDLKISTFVTGWAYGWRTKHEPQPSHRMQWWSVLIEGVFRVGNVAKLKELLESGIGPAKAFGFGLLSVAKFQPLIPNPNTSG